MNATKKAVYARAFMEMEGFNPVLEPMRWYQDQTHSDDSRLIALRELTDRFAPRLKSLEVTQTLETPLSDVTIQIITASPDGAPVIEGLITPAPAPALPHETYLPLSTDGVEQLASDDSGISLERDLEGPDGIPRQALLVPSKKRLGSIFFCCTF